jgi:hypothetical protein
MPAADGRTNRDLVLKTLLSVQSEEQMHDSRRQFEAFFRGTDAVRHRCDTSGRGSTGRNSSFELTPGNRKAPASAYPESDFRLLAGDRSAGK